MPRSEGKVRPYAMLKRLARKMNVEIKFASRPWEPRRPSPKPGEIQAAFDPGSMYNVGKEASRIREAVITKKAPEQIYTGGRRVRWRRTPEGWKEPIISEPIGTPASRFLALRPLAPGQVQPYSTPKGKAWTRVEPADIGPREKFKELPIYERNRLDWQKYLGAKWAGKTREEKKEAWNQHLQNVRELYSGEGSLPGSRLSSRELHQKAIYQIQEEMRRHREYLAGSLKKSRAIIVARGISSYPSARAHPERMIEYKKRLEGLTGERQTAIQGARERVGERLTEIARRGMNVIAGEQQAGWEAKRVSLGKELEQAQKSGDVQGENEIRQRISRHWESRKTPEQIKETARSAVGLLKDRPVSHGGPGLSELNVSALQDILQKGNIRAEPITTQKVRTIKKGLDVLYERGSKAGRGGVERSIIKSGALFRQPIEEARTGYPFLRRAGVGLAGAGLLAGGALAIHAIRKRSRERQLRSRLQSIQFALPPESERALTEYAKRIFQKAARTGLSTSTESIPGTLPEAVVKSKASPRLEAQRIAAGARKKWKQFISAAGGSKITNLYPGGMKQLRALQTTHAKNLEKIKILEQQARTKAHFGEEALKAQAEKHEVEKKEISARVRNIGVEEGRRAAAGEWARKESELTGRLGKESAKRAGRLKWIAAGTLTGGAVGGYALGRYDKRAHQRHEARQILDLYRPRQPRVPRQESRPVITIGISGNGQRRKQMEFQAPDDDEGPDWLKEWAHKRLYGRSYSTLGQAQRVKKYAGRTHRLLRDINLKRQGLPNIDVRGRPRKNEWEKPWVAGALTTAGLIGAIKGGRGIINWAKAAKPESRIGQLMEGFRRGAYAKDVPGLGKVGGAWHQAKEELARWRDKPLKTPPKYDVTKWDPETGKMKSEKQIAREVAHKAEQEALEQIGKGRKVTDFHSRLKEIRFQINKPQQDQPPSSGLSWHDVAAGGLESAGSYYTIDKLLQKYPSIKGIPKLGLTVGIGGIGTGIAGIALNRLLRQKIAAKRAARQQRLSSRLRLIKFQDPYYDEMLLPKTKSQRALVARDRYMKQIHERDIARADRLYKHSALIGAGIGALAARKPASLLRSAGIGAAVGIGAQKVARLYGQATRDPFGERTVRAKRVEEAPEVLGTAALAGYGLHRIRKLLSARNRLIHFQEQPQRKHRIAAGLAVAATGIPLYRGAGKFARIGLRSNIDKLAGKPMNYGKQVADYLEASQHILNQGVTGKLAGMALRNPKSAAVKWLVGKGPAELGSAKSGLNKINREHFSAFRSSHTEGLAAWSEEVLGKLRPGIQQRTHQQQSAKLFEHLNSLWSQGYNEREALRHAANDPQHQQLFRRLALFKAGPIKNYQKITAGLAAIPATAGLGAAATTRKERSRASAQ